MRRFWSSGTCNSTGSSAFGDYGRVGMAGWKRFNREMQLAAVNRGAMPAVSGFWEMLREVRPLRKSVLRHGVEASSVRKWTRSEGSSIHWR